MKTPTDEFDYDLPAELIAQQPLERRTHARLMLIDRRSQTIDHAHIADLPDHLREGDVLVLNESKVIPARLVGYRAKTRGRWQGLFLKEDQEGAWMILGKTRGQLSVGEDIVLADDRANDVCTLRMINRLDGGRWLARHNSRLETWSLLEAVGRVPLPHYIRDGEMMPEDVESYQTVFAREPGSVAAPTAGLHFTNELLTQLQQRGITNVRITLHVGLGTFRPIATDFIEDHQLHSERGQITSAAADILRAAREYGGRILAVGTTSCRVLESAQGEAWSGETNLFIHAPYAFPHTDALLTNFHLPRSSLLVLARAFGGERLMRRAYELAIQQQYRFYSYGDAMLIL